MAVFSFHRILSPRAMLAAHLAAWLALCAVAGCAADLTIEVVALAAPADVSMVSAKVWVPCQNCVPTVR